MFDTATNGLNIFNTSFANLGVAFLSTCLLIMAFVIASQVGGQGVQKPVRQLALVVGICAFVLKSYSAITTNALGLF